MKLKVVNQKIIDSQWNNGIMNQSMSLIVPMRKISESTNNNITID